MLTLALWLAAAQVSEDAAPPEGVEPEAVAAEEEAPAVEEAPPAEAPPPEPRQPFRQWGFTGNIGVSVPVQLTSGVGFQAAAGVRYAMRPPPDEGTYVSPAIAFRLAGSYQAPRSSSSPSSPPLGGRPVAEQPMITTDSASIGADVRLELTVSRRGGMLMPELATWLSTGSAMVFTGDGLAGIATHVGFGLGIDFMRDMAPMLARNLFTPETFAAMGEFTLRFAINCMLTGYGFLVGVVSIVVVPVVFVAAIGAIILGGTAVSAPQVEVRYTALATPRGIDGNTGLVIGIGI